jgi:hypothetical protein
MAPADSPKQKFSLTLAILVLGILLLAGWEFYNAWFIHKDLFWLFIDHDGIKSVMYLAFIIFAGIFLFFRSRTDTPENASQVHPNAEEEYEGSLDESGPEIPLETDSFNGRLAYYAMATVLILLISGTMYAHFRTLDVILWYMGSVLICSVLAFLLVRDWGTRWGINLLMSVLLAVFIVIVRMGFS